MCQYQSDLSQWIENINIFNNYLCLRRLAIVFSKLLLHSELLSFWTLSIVQYSKKLENTTFQKLDLFPSSGRVGRTPSQLGTLERANLNHWTGG
jgi:hypothetical protein